MIWAEKFLLAHRYLYYVLDEPILRDVEYDAIERGAMDIIPEDSPIRLPGSSNPDSYPPDVIRMAEFLLTDPTRIYEFEDIQ